MGGGKLVSSRFRSDLLLMSPTSERGHTSISKEEDDSDSLGSCHTNNGNHSRLGRKGDPRMHRATAARLANPGLSLIEALRIGGFDYPEDVLDDHYKLPGDTVSIGQRKNQLSRRCRLARQHPHSSGGATKKEGSKRKSKRTTHQVEPFVSSMDNQQPTDLSAAEARGQKRALDLGEADPMADEVAEASARQRMAKFHPEYHPIIVPPSHVPPLGGILSNQVQRGSSLSASLDNAATPAWPEPASIANPNALGESISHRTPHPSGVAVASLNATASSVGLTLEQLAVSLSSTTTLAKVLSDQTIPDIKQELALNLFRAECSTLYQRCMLLAGYTAQEAQDTSLPYKEFAYKAWSAEGERLEKNVGQQLDPSASSRTDLPEQGASENDAATNQRNSSVVANLKKDCNASNQCKTCGNGRHVHRLDGKCGHQAIIHQPDGAPPHVDFVVNGKVECYEGISPPGPGVWPSRFNCDQLNCPPDLGDHKIICGCDDECYWHAHEDPKIFDLSEINLNSKEWKHSVSENSLAGLIQLGSEDSTTPV